MLADKLFFLLFEVAKQFGDGWVRGERRGSARTVAVVYVTTLAASTCSLYICLTSCSLLCTSFQGRRHIAAVCVCMGAKLG